MYAPAMSFMMGCITAHSFLYFSPLVAMKYLFQAHLTPISLSNTCCAILSRNLTTKSNHNQRSSRSFPRPSRMDASPPLIRFVPSRLVLPSPVPRTAHSCPTVPSVAASPTSSSTSFPPRSPSTSPLAVPRPVPSVRPSWPKIGSWRCTMPRLRPSLVVQRTPSLPLWAVPAERRVMPLPREPSPRRP